MGYNYHKSAQRIATPHSGTENRPFRAHAKTYNSLLEKTFGRPLLNRQHRPPESLVRLYLYYNLQPFVTLRLVI